ncbi:hypothetical protein [Clostridium sp. Marseille-Q7071]
MDEIFLAFNNMQLNYNWLITDYECNDYPDEMIPYNKEYVWISGRDLWRVVCENGIQFIWGVFSAFSKDVTLNNVLKYSLPYADGNPNFWVKNINMQHPLAEIEIVPWDSSLVLLISKHDEIIESFLNYSPYAEDLVTYNSRE